LKFWTISPGCPGSQSVFQIFVRGWFVGVNPESHLATSLLIGVAPDPLHYPGAKITFAAEFDGSVDLPGAFGLKACSPLK
jgi:hypothetical protein